MVDRFRFEKIHEGPGHAIYTAYLRCSPIGQACVLASNNGKVFEAEFKPSPLWKINGFKVRMSDRGSIRKRIVYGLNKQFVAKGEAK